MGSSNDFRIRAGRLLRRSVGIGAYTLGALTGVPYARFVGLRGAAERALAMGDDEDAEALARQLLDMAERYHGDWYYGNALHHAHTILGLVELQRGNTAAAELALLESAKTPGSPQLNAFGPSMTLAELLLEMGRRDVVLEYLDACRAFWCSAEHETPGADFMRRRQEEWTAVIRDGGIPDFGANLVY